MLFVDDGLMVSDSPDQMDSVLAFIKDVFITKVTMDPKQVYVGVHIQRDRPHRTTYINQKLYIDTLLQKQTLIYLGRTNKQSYPRQPCHY